MRGSALSSVPLLVSCSAAPASLAYRSILFGFYISFGRSFVRSFLLETSSFPGLVCDVVHRFLLSVVIIPCAPPAPYPVDASPCAIELDGMQ